MFGLRIHATFYDKRNGIHPALHKDSFRNNKTNRAANEEEEDPHPRGFWLILLPHSPGNEIFDSSYSSFLEE